jgi:thioredoxin-related protein
MKTLFATLITLALAIAPVSHNFSNKKGVNWLTFEQASKLAQSKPKKMLIDVYTDWCGWCKRMDKTTYEDASVIDYINKHYYAVKLNAESGKTITYNGKSMTEQALSGQVFGVSGYPCTVYLDEKLKMLSPVPGYLDVPNFTKINKFFGENYHQKMSWEEYNQKVQ